MIYPPLIIYKKCSKNSFSPYGIPCQCVELIRRYFNLYYGLSFESVTDAYEMFYKINSLTNISRKTIVLDTIRANTIPSSSNSIRVGDIVFFKRNIKNGHYGHVAIVVYAANGTVVIAQQNTSKILEEYNTSDIIREMNKPDSQFLGIKRLPNFVIIPQQIQIQTK